jgi:hypothetical protein
MTCTVGIESPEGVWIGTDSISTDDSTQTSRAAEAAKVFHVGPYLLGFAGSFRAGDLLRYLRLPPPPARGPLHRHLVTRVVPAIREAFGEGGTVATKSGEEYGGATLLGVRGTLWQIHCDFAVGRPAEGYAAVGAGEVVALGALHATRGLEPRRRVVCALEAAEAHAAHVRRPWRVLRQLV